MSIFVKSFSKFDTVRLLFVDKIEKLYNHKGIGELRCAAELFVYTARAKCIMKMGFL